MQLVALELVLEEAGMSHARAALWLPLEIEQAVAGVSSGLVCVCMYIYI